MDKILTQISFLLGIKEKKEEKKQEKEKEVKVVYVEKQVHYGQKNYGSCGPSYGKSCGSSYGKSGGGYGKGCGGGRVYGRGGRGKCWYSILEEYNLLYMENSFQITQIVLIFLEQAVVYISFYRDSFATRNNCLLKLFTQSAYEIDYL